MLSCFHAQCAPKLQVFEALFQVGPGQERQGWWWQEGVRRELASSACALCLQFAHRKQQQQQSKRWRRRWEWAEATATNGSATASLATGMELGSAELKGTLQSLTGSKAKLLIKITDKTGGGGNDGDDNDGGDALVYAVNASFSSKLFRIKVGAVAASGLSAASKAAACQAESEKVLAHVSRDRGYAIDACLVRIMKARKTLTHPLLVAECFSQVKFPATGPEVKKRIESLLEREYLERDESDPNKYNYLA
mmetsp:Transcript_56785/g.113814  ORF Transcript_56785/g.113814 Transcript_56785/m.113814 type:complete len:251 (+) Transcript_56785:378-1130(+)